MPHMIFDSRDARCKTPFGAVPCETQIALTLRPPLAEGFLSCSLILWEEFAQRRREIPFTRVGEENGCQIFSGSYFAPEQPDLIWYLFRFCRENGDTLFLGKDGLCEQEDLAVSWQQTVYDSASPTPDWFGAGVTYQIFPDRFYRPHHLPPPDASGMVGFRVTHQNWDEPMELTECQGDHPGRDFFGGTLSGITEKLDYLQSLHISTLYLCPVFEAESNHRYNTADYEKIDPMLGTEEDFRTLCSEAKKRGIHIMLDGVFNHTGSNSRYFNSEGFFPSPGAAQSKESPYYPWYTFQSWPDQYDSWWGIRTLPAVNESHPDYIRFIIEGDDSVIRRWLRAGADAWRLDVADELPDEFIVRIRQVMMEEKPDSFLLGEVWEDGSNKISYDRRRKYLLGHETHGLMNYPFRTAALAYLLGGDAAEFMNAMETIRENYPPDAFYSGMNLLGTHDTPRILTLLGTSSSTPPDSREERAAYRLNEDEWKRGKQLLKIGTILLYTFPGSPTVYYGDEAGMQGFEDPMNRGTFPWENIDAGLREHYTLLGRLRMERTSLRSGTIHWLHAHGPLLALMRVHSTERTAVILNAGMEEAPLTIPWTDPLASDALSGKQFPAVNGMLSLSVPPLSGIILI